LTGLLVKFVQAAYRTLATTAFVTSLVVTAERALESTSPSPAVVADLDGDGSDEEDRDEEEEE